MSLIDILNICFRGTWYSLLGGNLAFLSMLKNPKKAVDYLVGNLFLYQLANEKGLPQKPLKEIFNNTDLNNLNIICNASEFMPDWKFWSGIDMTYLSLIAKIVNPEVIFEIGTYKGHSTYHFAANTPDNSIIYTLDLPDKSDTNPNGEFSLLDKKYINGYKSNTPMFVNTKYEKKIIRLYGDSKLFNFSDYYQKVDLFFVDGAHSYDYIESDTDNAFRCCRNGSVILWHDYGRYSLYGVDRFLHKLAREYPIYRLPGSAIAILQIKN